MYRTPRSQQSCLDSHHDLGLGSPGKKGEGHNAHDPDDRPVNALSIETRMCPQMSIRSSTLSALVVRRSLSEQTFYEHLNLLTALDINQFSDTRERERDPIASWWVASRGASVAFISLHCLGVSTVSAFTHLSQCCHSAILVYVIIYTALKNFSSTFRTTSILFHPRNIATHAHEVSSSRYMFCGSRTDVSEEIEVVLSTTVL